MGNEIADRVAAEYYLCFVCDYPANEASRIVRQANPFIKREWAKRGNHHSRRAFRNLQRLFDNMTLALPAPNA